MEEVEEVRRGMEEDDYEEKREGRVGIGGGGRRKGKRVRRRVLGERERWRRVGGGGRGGSGGRRGGEAGEDGEEGEEGRRERISASVVFEATVITLFPKQLLTL